MVNKKFMYYIAIVILIEISLSIIIYKKTNNNIIYEINSRTEYLWKCYTEYTFNKIHLMFKSEYILYSTKTKKDKYGNDQKYFDEEFKKKWIAINNNKADIALLMYRNEILLKSGKDSSKPYTLFSSSKLKKIFLETTTNGYIDNIIIVENGQIYMVSAKPVLDEYNSIEEIIEVFIVHVQDNIEQVEKILNSEINFNETSEHNGIINVFDYFDRNEKKIYINTRTNYIKTNMYVITIYTILLIVTSFLLMLTYYYKIMKIEISKIIKNKKNFDDLLDKQKTRLNQKKTKKLNNKNTTTTNKPE